MKLERGEPVAKVERSPAHPGDIGNVDKTAANLRSRQTMKITLQPSKTASSVLHLLI